MAGETGVQAPDAFASADRTVCKRVHNTIYYDNIETIARCRNNVPAAQSKPVKETSHVETLAQEAVQHGSGVILEDEARTIRSLGLGRRPVIEQARQPDAAKRRRHREVRPTGSQNMV